MIEDRLRAVRLDEPRLELDVDELVARAGRRRAILGAVGATCAVAVAMMAIGLAVGGQEERRSVPVAAAPAPTRSVSPPPTTPATTVDDCLGRTPGLGKVIAAHVPKVRLEQLSSCPVAVYQVVGTADFLTVGSGDAAVPLDGYVLTDDLSGPGDGRLHIYQGPDRGDFAVLLVDSDGTMVSVSTTGTAVDVDALIALVTDPALPR